MKFDLKTNRSHKKIVPEVKSSANSAPYRAGKALHRKVISGCLQAEQVNPASAQIKRILISIKKDGGNSFFYKKRLKHLCVITLFFVIYFVSAHIAEFENLTSSLLKIPKSLIWLFKNFLPSKQSLNHLPVILKSCFTTISAATAATVCAGFLALVFAVLSSETTHVNKPLKIFFTLTASVFRNLPLVAWSILLLFSFKQSEFTGFLALFAVTLGHLMRAFKEMIDETCTDCFKALRAAGVPYPVAVFQSVLPNIAPGILSWLLYAIENNIRDSALIGILTGTGVGFLFNLYFRSFRYNSAGLIIFILAAIVLAIDYASNKIRQNLL